MKIVTLLQLCTRPLSYNESMFFLRMYRLGSADMREKKGQPSFCGRSTFWSEIYCMRGWAVCPVRAQSVHAISRMLRSLSCILYAINKIKHTAEAKQKTRHSIILICHIYLTKYIIVGHFESMCHMCNMCAC